MPRQPLCRPSTTNFTILKMPPNRGQQHKPSPTVNQRRIFRGRGSPTDGNLPPKKSPRAKVKYEHHRAASSDDVQQSEDDISDLEEHADVVDINKLSLNGNGNTNDSLDNKNHDDNGCEEEDDNNNPLHKEIHHLQKRVQNITLSIQTSPLGISNPNTWRTNCLHPIKNVVKEWRSILSFHSQEISRGGREEQLQCDDVVESQQQLLQSNNNNNNNNTKHMELQQLLHETSTKVFILLQMAMQTGPLVGSNPGYFKRCGGEVASIALEFLTEVIGLAGVATSPAAADDDNDEDHIEECDGDSIIYCGVDAGENNDNKVDSPHSYVDSNSDDSSSSSTDVDREESENDEPANMASEITAAATSSPSALTKELLIVKTLQSSFLFTEKQSHRVYQWHRNAQKLVDTNKTPSKSASNLQRQKSKKQKQKDLKMERKFKKKNKGRGRK